MTSKLPRERNSQEHFQFIFQICVPNQKVQGKVTMRYIPEVFFKCND
jgi:hypothetical protein